MFVTLLESNSVKSTDSKLVALENAFWQLVILDIPTIFTLFNAVFDHAILLLKYEVELGEKFPKNVFTSPYTFTVIVDPELNEDEINSCIYISTKIINK